ncbi:hypothetical protein SEVIR_2G164901v4 [Setaria viridis]
MGDTAVILVVVHVAWWPGEGSALAGCPVRPVPATPTVLLGLVAHVVGLGSVCNALAVSGLLVALVTPVDAFAPASPPVLLLSRVLFFLAVDLLVPRPRVSQRSQEPCGEAHHQQAHRAIHTGT